MAKLGGSGTNGGPQGIVVAYGVPTRRVRDNRNVATPTAVNEGRKGSAKSGGTGGKKAR